jgi:hypothetical protein
MQSLLKLNLIAALLILALAQNNTNNQTQPVSSFDLLTLNISTVDNQLISSKRL